jgi:hypothetical protein
MVQLGIRPEYELVQAFAEASFAQLYNMSLDELLVTALGVATWGVGFTAHWVLTLQQRLLLLLPEADASQVAAVAVVTLAVTSGVSSPVQEELQLVTKGAAALVSAALEKSEEVLVRALAGSGQPAGRVRKQLQEEALKEAKEMVAVLLYVLVHGSGELLVELDVSVSWMEAMWCLVVEAAERDWLETWEVLFVFLYLGMKGWIPGGKGLEVVMKQGYRATASGAPAVLQEQLLELAKDFQEAGVLDLPARTRRIWEKDVEEAWHWERKLQALIKAQQEGIGYSERGTTGLTGVVLEGVWSEAERLGKLEQMLEHPLQCLAQMKVLRLVDGLRRAERVVDGMEQ